MIDAHPLFSCKGEGHFFDRLAAPIAKTLNDYNGLMDIVERTVYEGNGYYKPVPRTDFEAILRTWISERMLAGPNRPNVLLFGDKTPAHSFHLHFIKRIFPDAKFIHLIRDGRDVAVSAYFHIKRVANNDETIGEVPSWEELASPLLTKWHSFCKPCIIYGESSAENDMLTITYEDLKADTHTSLKNVFNFLLEDTASVTPISLDQCIQVNSFSKRSGRSEGTEDHQSFLRKGVIGDWKNHFTANILKSCESECLQLLRNLGYH